MNRKYLSTIIIFFLAGCLIGILIYQKYFVDTLENKQQLKVLNIDNLNTDSDNANVTKEKNLLVSSFITPHHMVAEKMIDSIFAEVSRKNKGIKINRIVLISPNHFNIGQSNIVVADGTLQHEDSIVLTDKISLRKISSLEFVREDKDAFFKEHGVRNLWPFINKYFPDTALISVMIKNGTPQNNIEEMVRVISALDGNTLVILSSDFSHYLSQAISNWHDKKAVDIISNFDYPAIYNLETDCVAGLYALMKFSELQNHKQFIWVNHSNSSEIYKEDFIGENTSYVTGYFSDEKVEKEALVVGRSSSILFLGDLMLDRHNRILVQRHGAGYFTEKIERLFWGQDLNVVNLEGPITDKPAVSVGQPVKSPNHFRFTFDPEQTINFLRTNRINLVNLGNNHILNFHNEGLEQTEKFLEESGVDYFGDPTDLEKMFVIKNINGRRIAFVNYNQFGKFTVVDTVKIIQEIKDKTDFIIVYTHWGQEYKLVENERQREKAHQFIDAGADLIIGSHPHVVQPLEIYKNKVIFYSLGNFVFDQYFSEDVKSILGVGVLLEDNKISFTLIPLYMQNTGQLQLMSGEQKQKFLQSLMDRSKISSEQKVSILNDGRLRLIQQ